MTLLTAVAALSTAAALALLAPARPRLPSRAARRVPPAGPLWLLVLVPVAVWLPVGWLVPAAVAAGAVAVGWLLWLRRRERRAAHSTGDRVLEACEHLASELASGLPPGAALARAADDWPVLAPAAEAFRVGSDVPEALRAVALRPGADDLRLLAAAWHVAHRTGQGLADAVERVARQLVDARATRRVVDGELASARATARLVALLPVVALLMGSGVGGDPVGFLLRTPAGWLCLATGLAFGLAGLWWIEALARDADRCS
ncbi:type II secretion system F family protein [Nocardioides halotolerans]|uniref:type II secretion system F family protein n=1 Tax=Nocardioides halotolerans TaxID=433660 RepID=UPI000418D3A0|nr:type II secretion system F family protein [Nocardioides halotolerans]